MLACYTWIRLSGHKRSSTRWSGDYHRLIRSNCTWTGWRGTSGHCTSPISHCHWPVLIGSIESLHPSSTLRRRIRKAELCFAVESMMVCQCQFGPLALFLPRISNQEISKYCVFIQQLVCHNNLNRSQMEQELKISPMPFGQARLPVQALFDFFPFRETQTQPYQVATFLQMFDSYLINKTERHEPYRTYLDRWLSPEMLTVKKNTQRNTTRSRWHSHRHKELKILAETCMASMKRLVCRYPLWQHINWQPVWIPGSQHVSTFSWCFLCYSLKIDFFDVNN